MELVFYQCVHFVFMIIYQQLGTGSHLAKRTMLFLTNIPSSFLLHPFDLLPLSIPSFYGRRPDSGTPAINIFGCCRLADGTSAPGPHHEAQRQFHPPGHKTFKLL
ncbi:unnamed protein product [Pleuronectes platessa]|uniref:Uncharacterized protein n=1 Tax=Pleuronectes platessa TaxID=8262 RepID=A0A9N7VRG3_PLEPL|nr:unnamed protein product [Pleuronectes platessa]